MRNYLGRIVLLVEDYEKSANFYEKTLALRDFLMLLQMEDNDSFILVANHLIL